MTYLERIAKAKAKYKGCTIAPQPIAEPEADNYQILNVKLVQPHRSTYFAGIGCNTGTRVTHLVRLKMCGRPLQTIRHIIEFYITPSNAEFVSDSIGTDDEPIASLISGYTRPFLFHSTQQAHDEIRHFLNTQI